MKSLWLKMPYLKEKLQKKVHWNITGAPFCLWQLVYSTQHPNPSAATEPRRPKTNSGWKRKLIEYQSERDPAGVCRHEGVFISHRYNYWTKRACLQFYTRFSSLWEKKTLIIIMTVLVGTDLWHQKVGQQRKLVALKEKQWEIVWFFHQHRLY